MAITNYTELQTAIGSYLARGDLTLLIPDFIAMAESEMNSLLRCKHNEASASAAISGGVLAIPAGYKAMKLCYIDKAEPVYLEPKTLSWIAENYPSSDPGEPRFFARRTTDFVFGPYPDSNYTIQTYYYKGLDLASSTTNAVLDDALDVYVYGTLYHSTFYTRQHSLGQEWGKKFYSAIEALNVEDNIDSVSGGPIAASMG